MDIPQLNSKLNSKEILEPKETPEQVAADIAHLQQWLLQQPHIYARNDNQWLLSFLRACKFSLHKTKEKLDNYYTVRSTIPEFFLNRDPYLPEIQKILSLGIFLPLDNLHGPKIILCRSENESYVSLLELLKTALMITDILLYEADSFSNHGQEILVDFNRTSVNNLMQLTPDICKKMIFCFKDSYPSRPNGFHLINMPSFFSNMLSFATPLLGKKLSSKITVYPKNDTDGLFKTMPRSVLPKEYGGNGDSVKILTEKWKAKMESYKDWFLDDSKYGSDESKRLKDSRISLDLFGAEGSFRQLTVD